MLLMHESIVEKETETNDFCWRLFLSTSPTLFLIAVGFELVAMLAV